MAINLTTMGERIEDLIKESGKSADAIAKEISKGNINISKATLSDLTNDVDKGYNYKYILEIAKYFNVSTDYLLCLTDSLTQLKADDDKALRTSCDYTSLNEKAINNLTSPPPIDNTIMKYLFSDTVQMPELLKSFSNKYNDAKQKIFEDVDFYQLISLLAYRAIKSDIYALGANQQLNDIQSNNYKLTSSDKIMLEAGQRGLTDLEIEIKALTYDIEQKYQKFFSNIIDNASAHFEELSKAINEEMNKIEVLDNE